MTVGAGKAQRRQNWSASSYDEHARFVSDLAGGVIEWLAAKPGDEAMRVIVLTAAFLALAGPAHAERISNPIAVFAGLDKITGLTTTFEARIGEEKRFGGLFVKADACYTRDITEEPKTTSFVEVEEIEPDDTRRKIFSGWMFAESPGLSAVEHPIYDVWLTGCRDPNAPPPVIEQAPEPSPDEGPEEEEPQD